MSLEFAAVFFDLLRFRVGSHDYFKLALLRYCASGILLTLLGEPVLILDDSCILYCSFSFQFSRDPIIAERGLRYRVGYLGVTYCHIASGQWVFVLTLNCASCVVGRLQQS